MKRYRSSYLASVRFAARPTRLTCFFGRFGRESVLRAGWSIHCVSRVFITGAVRGAARAALSTLPLVFIALEDRFV